MWKCVVAQSLPMNEMIERFVKTLAKTWKSCNQLWNVRTIRRKIILIPFCILGLFFVYSWAVESYSCAINAFASLIVFDVITLLGDVLNQYYTLNGASKASATFSFGLIRVEILIHFVTICFGLLYNLLTIKSFIEILNSNYEIHTGRFYPILLIGGIIHLSVSYSNPLTKILNTSTNYTHLQKYTQVICSSFGLISLKNPFIKNAFHVLGYFIGFIIVVLSFALDSGLKWFDAAGGFLIIFSIVDTLWPIFVYTSQVLLQTVPSHIVSQLEKALREALTIDGVLEFRNELFWTLTYGQIAGTLHVRVRRDANEQLVLLKVYEKLHPLASHLTIQITKDDFVQSFNTLHILSKFDSSQLSSIKTIMNSSPATISPIPTAPGNNKHVLYSNSSNSSVVPQSKYSAVNIPSANSDELDVSNASVFNVETPNVFTPYNSNTKYAVGGNNPFTIKGTVSTSSMDSFGQNSNILISSATNYYPDS